MIARRSIFSFFVCVGCLAQTPAPRAAFEVASIKSDPNCGSARGGGGPPRPGRIYLSCQSLRTLIQVAYSGFTGSLQSSRRIQALGGPAWIDSEPYDIEAKAQNASVSDMQGPMLTALLEERFGLKVHWEARPLPIYALTVAKNGPKIQAIKPGGCTELNLNHPVQPEPGQPMPGVCGRNTSKTNGPNVTLEFHGAAMRIFAERMGLDRPVIDKTGLDGLFDIHVEFVKNDGSAETSSLGESIFSAMQDQLGLKLSAEVSPVEVLVIDEIHKPTEN